MYEAHKDLEQKSLEPIEGYKAKIQDLNKINGEFI